MYLEGKSYYQIATILDEEKILYPEKSNGKMLQLNKL